MTFDKSSLSNYVAFKKPVAISLGGDGIIQAYGKGTCHIVTDVNGKSQRISLNNILYLPELGKNLLSVRAMAILGSVIQFESDKRTIQRNCKVLGVGELRGRLYLLRTISERAHKAEEVSDLHLWHCRLGHLGTDNGKKLFQKQMVNGMEKLNTADNKVICEGCIMGKQHRMPYPRGLPDNASEPMEIIHSDICGPMNIESLRKSKYFVTFIDGFSRYTCIYYLKQKSEVLEKFKEFVNVMTNLKGKKVKILRTDNGGEYCSHTFAAYLKENGIFHQTTVRENPAQNEIAERMNRTIIESARSLIYHSKLPMAFWAEAVNAAAHLRNSSPTVAVKNKTPFECLFSKKPDISNLKVFGCLAFIHIIKIIARNFRQNQSRLIYWLSRRH